MDTQEGKYSGDGGPATLASLSNPVSLAMDVSSSIYISDQLNNVISGQLNNVVSEVSTRGSITTVDGTGVFGFSDDGGPATKAEFGYPAGAALDAAGNRYIVNVNKYRIRVMLTNGTIEMVAGDGIAGFAADGGPATSAEMNAPRSVAVGTLGDVCVADFSNNRVRQLTPGSTTLGDCAARSGGITPS